MKFRHQQLLVSAIGAVLIIPLELFLGVMFTFPFTGNESAWAWIFDFISFWTQIIGIIMSFFKPRIAAAWMLLCLASSVSIGIIFELKMSYSGNTFHPSASQWLKFAPSLLRTAAIFWGIPLLFALLLARKPPSFNRAHSDVSIP